MLRYLPFMAWAQHYSKAIFIADISAALIVSIMLIPQAIAYALLAGLPPQTGLYASLLPLCAYSLFGKSSALSVGPFAITSIMTAAALGAIFHGADVATILIGAALLALLSGAMLLAFGILRLGFLSNLISFPVVTGFISASALVIAASQITHILGLPAAQGMFLQQLWAALSQFKNINIPTLITALAALSFLKFMPKLIASAALKLGMQADNANLLGKTAPLLMVIGAILLSAGFDLQQYGIAVVGTIPTGFPSLAIPDIAALNLNKTTWYALINSAALISIIGFVTTLSTAQAFAVKTRLRISPNQEAVALGMANLAAGVTGAFPVTGSLSRSAVSFAAGAQTPAASAYTALGVALSCMFLTPFLYYLPVAALSAMIIVAIMSLFDHITIAKTLRYSLGDFVPLIITMLITLSEGLEWGLIAGVLLSFVVHLWRSAKPHAAILGQVPNMQHFRNIERHEVITDEHIVNLRIDASLYFANAKFLEDKINQIVADYPHAKHLIFNCAAINGIDISALQSLFVINQYLLDAGIKLHLAELKGPVMDTLQKSNFLEQLGGKVYLTHYLAWAELRAAYSL